MKIAAYGLAGVCIVAAAVLQGVGHPSQELFSLAYIATGGALGITIPQGPPAATTTTVVAPPATSTTSTTSTGSAPAPAAALTPAPVASVTTVGGQ